jgi:hypothetical protein
VSYADTQWGLTRLVVELAFGGGHKERRRFQPNT